MLGSVVIKSARNLTNVEFQLLRQGWRKQRKLIIKELWSIEEESPHFPTYMQNNHFLDPPHVRTERGKRERDRARAISAWASLIFYCSYCQPSSQQLWVGKIGQCNFASLPRLGNRQLFWWQEPKAKLHFPSKGTERKCPTTPLIATR